MYEELIENKKSQIARIFISLPVAGPSPKYKRIETDCCGNKLIFFETLFTNHVKIKYLLKR